MHRIRITISREITTEHYISKPPWDDDGNFISDLSEHEMAHVLEESYKYGDLDCTDLLDEAQWAVEVIDGLNGWSFDVPTEPGMYWFSGWAGEFALNRADCKQETILVKVDYMGSGKLYFSGYSQFLYPKSMYGVWRKAFIPVAPVLNKEDRTK